MPKPSIASLGVEYYQAVEEFFVSRRGDPLFLSNSDWLLIHQWRNEGVPLRVVLRGIADAMEGHAHSWSRHQKVGSLAYCRGEVEAARARWQRALALGEEEGADTRGRLLSLAEILDKVGGLGPACAGIVRETARELRALAAAESGRSLEPWLQAREAKLYEALAAEAGTDVLAEHEAAIERELAPFKERMPAKVLAQIRAESRTRRLFEQRGLPRLSLFDL